MSFIKGKVPLIRVNAMHLNYRQRSTIADELGQVVLYEEQLDQGVILDQAISILKRYSKSAKLLY